MHQSTGQKLLYLVIFIILVGSLAFAIVSSRDTKKAANTSQSGNTYKGTNKYVTPSTSEESTSASDTSSKPSQSASSSSSQLAAAGPKETVGLFVVTVAAGTAIAHRYQRRTTQNRV